jgi:2-keto-3-deoxy-6-phosphogluconate aldolase
LGVSGAKTANDQPRIGIEENLVGNVNQTYSINAPRTFSTANGDAAALNGLASPFVPAVGSTMQYLTTYDPIDADVTNNSTLGDGNDLYYLFRFDFINIISLAELTASLTSFEVASVDTATYNTNETSIARYGSTYNAFDDWSQLQGGSISLVGGGTILTSVTSATATAGSVVIVTPNTNQLSSTVPEAFVEMTNANGTADIDDLNVVEGAAYRADYSIAMDGGSSAGVIPGNTYGIPALRLRTATPIPTFSIEYIVTPRNTNAFPTEGVAATLSMYWTASSQFAAGTSANEEDDAQMVFGVLDSEFTDGTCTLSGLRIFEVNSDDPNVDY